MCVHSICIIYIKFEMQCLDSVFFYGIPQVSLNFVTQDVFILFEVANTVIANLQQEDVIKIYSFRIKVFKSN